MSDQQTKSATEQSRRRPACAECGWQVVTDLALVATQAGTSLVLCMDPWACWMRQVDLEEHHGLSGASW